LSRADAGKYIISVDALDASGFTSNIVFTTLIIARRNSAPLLSTLSAPDTVSLPVSGYVTVQFTVAASDSDGLTDIRQVFFRRISPVDPTGTRFTMRDDGNQDPPVTVGSISVRSGDRGAGDGSFSFLLPLPFDATRRTNIFGFQAVDSFGDTSATILHSLTVR
jgi:hypothetical protein